VGQVRRLQIDVSLAGSSMPGSGNGAQAAHGRLRSGAHHRPSLFLVNLHRREPG
jgi:hypothetical protein